MHSSGPSASGPVREDVLLGQLDRLELLALVVLDHEVVDRLVGLFLVVAGLDEDAVERRSRRGRRPLVELLVRLDPRVDLPGDEDVVLDAVDRDGEALAGRLVHAGLLVAAGRRPARASDREERCSQVGASGAGSLILTLRRASTRAGGCASRCAPATGPWPGRGRRPGSVPVWAPKRAALAARSRPPWRASAGPPAAPRRSAAAARAPSWSGARIQRWARRWRKRSSRVLGSL